jgi:hypothetical protein
LAARKKRADLERSKPALFLLKLSGDHGHRSSQDVFPLLTFSAVSAVTRKTSVVDIWVMALIVSSPLPDPEWTDGAVAMPASPGQILPGPESGGRLTPAASYCDRS